MLFGRRSTPVHRVHIASTDSSPRASVSAEDTVVVEDVKMADPYAQNRPLSVTIPQTFGAQGPYCPRRPHLSDILANESPPPWTLSAFMAYLSQNHCLETLEFTMDASRYGKHYAKMLARLPGRQFMPGSEEANYLLMLWQRLLEAYIAPNGPREVNLPSEVRNGLLSLVPNLGGLPPPPNALDTAVQHIYSLMEESVLVPFLNSFYPQSAHPEYADSSDDNNFYSAAQQPQSATTYTAHTSRSYDERFRSTTNASQPAYTSSSASLSSSSSSSNNAQNRASAPSTFQHITRNFSVRAPTSQRASASPALMHLHHHHHDSSKSASPSPAGTDSDMTDADLLSTISTTTSASINAAAAAAAIAGSPTTASVGLHTPPNTPPTGDFYYCHDAGGASPVATATSHESSSPREKERAGAWKRVGTKLGLGRKSGVSRRGSPPGGAGADVVMEE